MWRRRLVVMGLSIVLLLSALYVGVAVPFGNAAAHAGLVPNAAQYSAPGPHLVAMRDVVIDGKAPLDAMMWYPTSSGQNRTAKIKYAYEMKMGAPFGTVRFATFAGQALRDAAPDRSTGPYPLVILSPGFSIGASTYAWLAEHLASYGFVVIAPDHDEHLDEELNGLWRSAITRPQDVLTVLAYVDDQTGPGQALEGLVDAEMVAVVGHSYGGYTALAAGGAQIDTADFEAQCETAYEANDPNAWLCDQLLPHVADMAELAGLDAVPEGLWQQAWADPRIDAIVPLAGDAFFFGQDGLAEITVPVMAIGGTRDSDAPYEWGTYPAYEYASSTIKVRIALLDAEHMIFTGPCEATPLLLRLFSSEFCSDPGWDRTYAHALIGHFTTAFLLDVLKGDQTAHKALLPDAAQFDGTEYTATLE